MAVLLCIRWQPCVRKLRTMRANIYERCTSYKLRDVRARVFGTTNLNIFTNNQQPTTTNNNHKKCVRGHTREDLGGNATREFEGMG